MPITIFSEGDILGAWTPVIGPRAGPRAAEHAGVRERLDKEEFALVGELALIAEDCYRAWSAEVDTDGAEWRQVQWSYTERNDHRSMVLHIGRWDGELVEVRTSAEGLSRLIRRLSQAQARVDAQGRQDRQRRARARLHPDRRGPRDAGARHRRLMAVRIEQALPESARTAAAELYWEAFGRLLRPALGRSDAGPGGADGRPRAVARDRRDGRRRAGRPRRAALRRPRLHAARRPVAAAAPRHRAACRASCRCCCSPRRPPAGELRIDGIAVRGDRRGAGIGSLLLREAAGRARAVGIEVIRLEVVDTNPRARSLYEREGYVAVRTEHTPVPAPGDGIRRGHDHGAPRGLIQRPMGFAHIEEAPRHAVETPGVECTWTNLGAAADSVGDRPAPDRDPARQAADARRTTTRRRRRSSTCSAATGCRGWTATRTRSRRATASSTCRAPTRTRCARGRPGSTCWCWASAARPSCASCRAPATAGWATRGCGSATATRPGSATPPSGEPDFPPPSRAARRTSSTSTTWRRSSGAPAHGLVASAATSAVAAGSVAVGLKHVRVDPGLPVGTAALPLRGGGDVRRHRRRRHRADRRRGDARPRRAT